MTDRSVGRPSTSHTNEDAHIAERILLTSNPSANWHVELTPIATCQSPFNSDSTAADSAEGVKKFRGDVAVCIYLRVTCTRVIHACTCTPVRCRKGGGGRGEGLLTSSANLLRNYSTRLFPPSAVSWQYLLRHVPPFNIFDANKYLLTCTEAEYRCTSLM